MTTATLQDYGTALAAEVRAMAARRQIKGKEIAAYLGVDEMHVSRRMTGKTEWSVGELVALTGLFHCSLEDLLPHLDSNQKPFDSQSIYALAA